MDILKSLINEIEDKELKDSPNIITAPSDAKAGRGTFKVFLAGTIDSGKSYDWQKEVCKKFLEEKKVTIFNPRRDEWPDEDGEEIRQIKWEHNHMDEADMIIMNIMPESKSPISLMEIGMYSQSGKLEVFCTDKFYRFNNVKVVCEKYGIKLHETNDLNEITNVINKKR